MTIAYFNLGKDKVNMQLIHENQAEDYPNLSETDSKADKNSSLMNRMRLNDNKAGMDGLDKEKINQVILEASKGIYTELKNYVLLVIVEIRAVTLVTDSLKMIRSNSFNNC